MEKSESAKFAPKQRKTYSLICQTCGNEFTATRNDAKYCKPYCNLKAHRQRHNAPTVHELVCEMCKDAFTANKSNARYCSQKCRTAASRQRIIEATKRAAQRRSR